jgi:hypothetical protein
MNEANDREFNDYKKTIFGRALHKYYKPYCTCSNEYLKTIDRSDTGMYNCGCDEENIFVNSNVFNCNEKSDLKAFPFKNIMEA